MIFMNERCCDMDHSFERITSEELAGGKVKQDSDSADLNATMTEIPISLGLCSLWSEPLFGTGVLP